MEILLPLLKYHMLLSQGGSQGDGPINLCIGCINLCHQAATSAHNPEPENRA